MKRDVNKTDQWLTISFQKSFIRLDFMNVLI